MAYELGLQAVIHTNRIILMLTEIFDKRKQESNSHDFNVNQIVSFQTEFIQFAIDTIRRWFEFLQAALMSRKRRNRSICV